MRPCRKSVIWRHRRAFGSFGAALLAALLGWPVLAHAESLSEALVRAYVSNPNLNQQRVAVRAADEGVSKAVAGYRPQVSANATLGYNYIKGSESGLTLRGPTFPTSEGLTVTQNIFNGFQTLNGVRLAESTVLQSRETTVDTEQTTLQSAATAYMNVLRDIAILELNKNNIIVLEEQLRQSRERWTVGELTRTDVAQSESQLATGRSNYYASQSNLQGSIAAYRQVIGIEPKRLEPARPLDALVPRTLESAVQEALTEHPSIRAALFNVEKARAQVHIAEGALAPSVNLVGNVQQNNQSSGLPTNQYFNASVLGQVNVPVYAGGAEYATIRQAKELLSQALIQADVQRDTVRANLVTVWGQLEAAKAVVRSSHAAVSAAEIALNGVRDEARVGQRTTLDVLLAQQTLLNARVSLVSAERDRVVISYSVVAAAGRLSASRLGLDVTQYSLRQHYEQVKDKWFGLRTPDGK